MNSSTPVVELAAGALTDLSSLAHTWTKQRPFPHRRLCCPSGSIGTTAASDALLAGRPFPHAGYRAARSDGSAAVGPARASTVPVVTFRTFRTLYTGEFFTAALQDLHRFHGLRPEGRGSALPFPATRARSRRGRFRVMLRTARLLPLEGLLTLGFDPDC